MKVFIIAAVTIDGFIARDSQQISTSWTSAEDKKFFSQRTKAAGVVVLGRKTYETIGRPLPGRLNVIYTTDAAGVKEKPGQLQVTQLLPPNLIKQLEHAGHKEIAICGGPSIYTMFLKSGVVDTLYLTMEPILFGKGIKLFSDELNVNLKLKETTHLSAQTLLLEYAVK